MTHYLQLQRETHIREHCSSRESGLPDVQEKKNIQEYRSLVFNDAGMTKLFS